MVADHEVRTLPEVTVTDRILVVFKAPDSGVDELSWGQQDMWLVMRRRRVWIPLSSVVRLWDGATVDEVAARLQHMMARYPTLRTRLRFDPDTTRQVVAGEGEIGLDVVDVPADADPRRVADRLGLQYMDREYDFATEWPVRIAVVCHRGVPTYQVMVLCHLVLDGAGAAVLAADLAGWDPTTGELASPPPPMPPLEQVRQQRLPAARRQSDAAMRHWESTLRAAPTWTLGTGLGGEQPKRYWKGHLTSPATQQAVRAVSTRTRVDSSAVLLTLYAAALARMTGVSPVLVQVIVGNRFRPGLAGTVSPVFQPGLCLVDIAGVTFDEAVAKTRRRRLSAFKHAYYDPCQRDDLVARLARERGGEVELGCYLNDRRFVAPGRADGVAADGASADPGRAGVVPEQVSARSSFEWTVMENDEFTEPLYLFVDDRGDPPEALILEVSADTRRFSPRAMEALVRGMEAVAVQAAWPEPRP